MARPIMEQLITNGKVSRGYLGVSIGSVTPLLAKDHKLTVERGALISDIVDPSGAAAKAGLTQGDVVVGMNGNEIKTGDALRNAIAMSKPGTQIELQVVRLNGSKDTIKLKLGEMPSDQQQLRIRRQQQQQQQQQRRQMIPQQP
jgi:serine protease Do